MEPLFDPQYRVKHPELATALVCRVPFTPSLKLDQSLSWQANDPLVHYHWADLARADLTCTNTACVLVLLAQQRQTNRTNLGLLNNRYNPWGGRPGQTGQGSTIEFNSAVKDPLVWRSDDWAFPAEPDVNVCWLDRVHRGTPWQTIYLNSTVAADMEWALAVGWANPWWRRLSHPTNDWRLVELFLDGDLALPVSAAQDSAPVLVNNTFVRNLTARDGAAVYLVGGVSPAVANNIVFSNASGLFAREPGSTILRANCVYGNAGYDYAGLAPGVEDLAADPQFLPVAPGFWLMATSPCVDAGDDLVIAAGWIHGDEPARRVGAHLDLGAHELTPATPPWVRLTEIHETGAMIRVVGLTGQRSTLQGSEDLVGWWDVGTGTSVGGFFDVLVEPGDNGAQFYRAFLAP